MSAKSISSSAAPPLFPLSFSDPAMSGEFSDPARMHQLHRLMEWRDRFGKDFAAHGVVTNNVEAVLKDGRLRCGENILRRTRKLEFEGGAYSGSREYVYLPENNIPEFAEQVAEVQKEILDAFSFSDADIEKTIRHVDLEYKAEKKYPIAKKDLDSLPDPNCERSRYRKAALEALAQLPGKNIWSKDLLEFDEYLKRVARYFFAKYPHLWASEYKPRELYALPLLALHIDETLPKEQKLKALLVRIFKIYRKLIDQKEIEVGLVEMGPFLDRLRKARLAEPYKINPDIRVYKNNFTDCYPGIMILIGGTERIIGSKSLPGTGEYCLLSPGQNGGKFFKVDLSSSNVLIVGPKEVLSKYADNPQLCRNIIFSENVKGYFIKKEGT